jgi:uncharacterized protein (TIGR01370 family)
MLAALALASSAAADGACGRRAAGPPTFGVQYWGETYDADRLSAAPHDLLIVEATLRADRGSGERRFTATEVRRMRRDGARPVLAYLNLAEIEAYRDYMAAAAAAEAAPPWIGARSPQDEALAAFWTPAWAAILRARIDAFLALGFDGVMLDDALHFYTWGALDAPTHARDAPQSPAAFARAMMALVLDLADHARRRSAAARCGFRIVVNNGVWLGADAAADRAPEATALYERYRAALDGVLVESAVARGDAPSLDILSRDYRAIGVAVLLVEFETEAGAARDASALRADTMREAAERGFSAYVAGDHRFDRLYPPLRPGLAMGDPPLAAPTGRFASAAPKRRAPAAPPPQAPARR